MPTELISPSFFHPLSLPQVQENDACFSTDRVPTPANYGAKRRMLRRYDETLIVDLDVVSVQSGR